METPMKILATLAALAVTIAAPAAWADAPGFLTKAAQGGMAEVAAGELAASKATDPEVRAFGTMMVRDHGAANQKVAALAKAKGVQLPETPGDAHKATLDSLRAIGGADFDRAYISQMVKSHENTRQMLQSEIASGQDADVKKLASEMLPTVETHLKEATRLKGKVGAP
jgi:putative membrane protein